MATDALADACAALSLKDLRSLIGESGLTTDGCIDKADLRARGMEALERLKLPGARLGPVSKPIVAALVADDLNIFDTPDDQAKKAEEAASAAEAAAEAREAAKKARAVEAAATQAASAAEKAAQQEAAVRAVREAEKQQKKMAKQEATAAAADKAAVSAEADGLIAAMRANDSEKFSTLLHSLGPNCQSDGGHTPLHYAATQGLEQMAKLILAAGGDPNMTNDETQTPLHQAALFNKVEVAKLLLAAGADMRKLDTNGQTALDYARINNR